MAEPICPHNHRLNPPLPHQARGHVVANYGRGNPVGHQLVHAHHAVNADADLGGLAALARERRLVDGKRLALAALDVARDHLERMNNHGFGAGETFLQALGAVIVHQESDAAAMHAVERHLALAIAVEGFQHEAVAAQRHDDVGLFRRRVAVAGLQLGQGLLRLGRLAGNEGYGAEIGHGLWERVQPPVTLMWRGTETAPWRRSMMKSWPLGLRAIAARMASSKSSSPSEARNGVRRSALSCCPRHI